MSMARTEFLHRRTKQEEFGRFYIKLLHYCINAETRNVRPQFPSPTATTTTNWWDKRSECCALLACYFGRPEILEFMLETRYFPRHLGCSETPKAFIHQLLVFGQTCFTFESWRDLKRVYPFRWPTACEFCVAVFCMVDEAQGRIPLSPRYAEAFDILFSTTKLLEVHRGRKGYPLPETMQKLVVISKNIYELKQHLLISLSGCSSQMGEEIMKYLPFFEEVCIPPSYRVRWTEGLSYRRLYNVAFGKFGKASWWDLL